MGFLGRWLSDAISIGLSLTFGLAAMQVPALTHDYKSALLQVAEDVRRDIDQRENSARHFYHLTASTDEAVIAALQPFEPSNAQSLSSSLERARNLRRAFDRIDAAPPIFQPVVAAIDIVEDTKGYKSAVLGTMLATFAPQVIIGTAAALYGAMGLVIGSFFAQILIAGLGRLLRAPQHRSSVQA